VPNEADRRNFAYDSKHAVQIVEQYLAEWKYQKPDFVESQIREAKAKVEGGFEAYAERLRQDKIQMYEDRLAKGGFALCREVVRSPRPRADGLDRARFRRPALLGPH
jgi:hypothetical protein